MYITWLCGCLHCFLQFSWFLSLGCVYLLNSPALIKTHFLVCPTFMPIKILSQRAQSSLKVSVCAQKHKKQQHHHHTRTHRSGRSGFALRFFSSGYKSPEPWGAERWWRSPGELLEPENTRQLSYLQQSRRMHHPLLRLLLWGVRVHAATVGKHGHFC